MENLANRSQNYFLPYEEDYNTDFRYENDDDNPNLSSVEENESKDDYYFYPDTGF